MHHQTQLLLSALLLLQSSPSLSSPLPASASIPASTPSSPQLGSAPESAAHTVLPITPRSALLAHPIFAARDYGSDSDSEIPIFDSAAARLVREELQGVKNKYAKAVQYLNGVQVAEADVSFDPSSQKSVLVPQQHRNGTNWAAHAPSGMSVSHFAPSSASASHFETGATVNAPSAVTKTASIHSMVTSATPLTIHHSSSSSSYTPSATWSPLSSVHLGVASSSHLASSIFSTSTTSAGADISLPTLSAVGGHLSVPELGTELELRDLESRASTSASTSSIALTDYMSGSLDVLYYGSLSIGTPAQTLSVDFDTGSADLWLPVGCSNCNGAQFNAGKSSSYRKTGDSFSVEYGSGSVSGYLATENVQLANTYVSGQYFGAVNSESSDFQGNPNSGVIGMAFSSISSSGKSTYFENLIANKGVSQPLFGFHLTRKQATGSQLCIGCYDSSKFTGAISWIPVISQTYWSVSMTGFSANGNKQNALSQSIIAAMDTGTTLIYVPTSVADSFYAQIPGASKADQFGEGFYQFPCKPQSSSTSAYALSISLNGKPFSINFADFNLGKTASGSSMCVGGVLAVGDGFPDNLAIVGDEFLKSWYSIYDYSNNVRVGLASSINNH